MGKLEKLYKVGDVTMLEQSPTTVACSLMAFRLCPAKLLRAQRCCSFAALLQLTQRSKQTNCWNVVCLSVVTALRVVAVS